MFNFLQMFKEQDGQWSGRRVTAFLFAVFFFLLSAYPIYAGALDTWKVFIPAMLCIAVIIFLFFFTSWTDVNEIIKSVNTKTTVTKVSNE